MGLPLTPSQKLAIDMADQTIAALYPPKERVTECVYCSNQISWRNGFWRSQQDGTVCPARTRRPHMPLPEVPDAA